MSDVGTYVTIELMGKFVLLLQCPHCQEFMLLRHNTMRPGKVRLCEECESHFAEPASNKGILHISNDTTGVGWPD